MSKRRDFRINQGAGFRGHSDGSHQSADGSCHGSVPRNGGVQSAFIMGETRRCEQGRLTWPAGSGAAMGAAVAQGPQPGQLRPGQPLEAGVWQIDLTPQDDRAMVRINDVWVPRWWSVPR